MFFLEFYTQKTVGKNPNTYYKTRGWKIIKSLLLQIINYSVDAQIINISSTPAFLSTIYGILM